MADMSIVLVGIGGYGGEYVRALLSHPERKGVAVVGAVDPYATSCPYYDELHARGVPIYDNLPAFYAGHGADLAIISAPIAFHEEMAIYAMEHGSHVLVEKPAAATPEGVRSMMATRNITGKKLAVGFQWCFDPAMRRLKADVDKGRLGRPIRMRSLVMWPRDRAYFARTTGWAGRKYDAQGRPVFDSIASNATAHFFQILTWLSGSGFEGARITSLTARTARANDIETYDTVALSAKLEGGCDLYFAASHAAGPSHVQQPMLECAFERAVVRYGGLGLAGGPLVALFADGSVADYGHPDHMGVHKLWMMIDALREGAIIPCPAESALTHAEAIDLIQRCRPEAEVFPADKIRECGNTVYVPGLGDAIIDLYKHRELPDSFAECL